MTRGSYVKLPGTKDEGRVLTIIAVIGRDSENKPVTRYYARVINLTSKEESDHPVELLKLAN